MSSAKLTLNGMYRWDDSLFNDMILPEGIDKDLLLASLLMEKGEFEVLYPDPAFMKQAIKIWSGKWFRTFAEWVKGTKATWNPIYNYDRYEESKDVNKKEYGSVTNADYEDQRITDLQDKRSVNLHDERSSTLQDKRTADLQDKRSVNLKDATISDLADTRTADLKESTEFNNADTTQQMSDTTTEHLVSAYDSSGYSPSSKDIVNNGSTKVDHSGNVDNKTTGTDKTTHTGTDTTDHTGTDTTAHTGTDTTDHSGTEKNNQTGTDTMNHTGSDTLKRSGKLSDVDGHEKDDNVHSAHLYGNIGVTTSAAMLREFYDIAKWNLYEHIADVFSSELLISVY